MTHIFSNSFVKNFYGILFVIFCSKILARYIKIHCPYPPRPTYFFIKSYYLWSKNQTYIKKIHGIYFFNDTHREKAPSNKTPALTKGTNMVTWIAGITNQLCITGS